jgi:F0F1-type ATP synthase assembly protein I
MEKTAYILLLVVVLCWLIGMLIGMVAAFPFGLIGLIGIVGIGLLFIKVLKDRLQSKDDDYYSKNIDK